MSQVRKLADGTIEVSDDAQTLRYTGYEVTDPAGNVISHESRGGTLSSVWATEVGTAFVEISHLGDGPAGGELVMVVTLADGSTVVALGDLVVDQLPATVSPSWPVAIDLAIGLVATDTIDSGSRTDLEDFHQRLLGVLFGE
ncbi:MAG TPA: hypothetical protein PLQ19_00455 [Aeromicrobium sp.]|nr:hypothetical protein [Aeromicrobium sp.]